MLVLMHSQLGPLPTSFPPVTSSKISTVNWSWWTPKCTCQFGFFLFLPSFFPSLLLFLFFFFFFLSLSFNEYMFPVCALYQFKLFSYSPHLNSRYSCNISAWIHSVLYGLNSECLKANVIATTLKFVNCLKFGKHSDNPEFTFSSYHKSSNLVMLIFFVLFNTILYSYPPTSRHHNLSPGFHILAHFLTSKIQYC